MREILFRGQVIRNDTMWVEGFYVHVPCGRFCCEEHLIQTINEDGKMGSFFTCYESTIGQYTGLKDKNGKRIFEGDIIKSHYANVPKADFVEEVVFHNGKFCAMYQKDKAKMWCPLADGVPHHPGDRTAYMEWCEVIGNIHDNPELLEGGGV